MEDFGNAGNSVATETGNPSSEPVVTSNGTGTPSGEASQSATAQESFIPNGVDINTLPPQLRAQIEKINSDMVRGFTEKTTKLSETIKSESAKATEAYRTKAEFYDQIAQQEDFVRQWNEYVQKQQASGQPAQEGDPVLTKLQAQIQEMNQKMQLSEIGQVTEAFADATDEKGQKLHPEFDALNALNLGQLNTNGQAEDFSLLRACIELSPGNTPSEKLANGYKSAKATYDAIFESGRKAGMGRLQNKVANSTLPASHSGMDTLSVTEKKPKNAHEAMQMAKRGIMVSRD